MRIDIITVFPGFFQGPFQEAIIKRSVKMGLVELNLHDLRDYTNDKHRSVDDVPYGGGAGMVFKPEPIFRAVESVALYERGKETAVILLSPRGKRLDQDIVKCFTEFKQIVIICPRYKGVDERVREFLATHDISIGDYVIAGGDAAAVVLVESVVRLVPGVLGDFESAETDSFYEGDYYEPPLYTRPFDFRGMKVPDVLLSGNHRKIEEWKLDNRETVKQNFSICN